MAFFDSRTEFIGGADVSGRETIRSADQNPVLGFSVLISFAALSLGSFSKILAPGLRLGWVQGPPELLRRLASCGFLDSGGGLAPFTSAVVAGLLESGAQERHLSKLRGIYGARARALAACRDLLAAVLAELS